MNGPAISRRVIVAIAALGVVSLLAGFVAAISFEPAPAVRSAAPDAFSRSAIGHRGFVELLRRLDRRVLVSRSRSAERAAAGGVLVLLEPPGDAAELARMLGAVDRALVVLPKWRGEEAEEGGWIRGAGLLDRATPEALLAALGLEGSVVRPARSFEPTLGALADRTIRLPRPQLAASADLDAVVGSGDGVLVGRTERSLCGELWLLSDPDLVQNHGLGDGDNAAYVAALIDQVARPGELIVIDETLHGHEVAPHVWGVLGRFPLVLALLHGFLLVVVLIWVAARRLGSPLPDPPALRPGRMTLVDSTAELLLHGGHSRSILARYLRNEERRVAAACGLPRGLDAGGRRRALAQLEERRRPTTPLEQIVAAVDRSDADQTDRGARLLATARTIHRWRTEMSHGAQ